MTQEEQFDLIKKLAEEAAAAGLEVATCLSSPFKVASAMIVRVPGSLMFDSYFNSEGSEKSPLYVRTMDTEEQAHLNRLYIEYGRFMDKYGHYIRDEHGPEDAEMAAIEYLKNACPRDYNKPWWNKLFLR